MAAQALVRATYRDPVETYAVNVMGLVHLLDAVRRTDSVRVIVNVTSDKCYENHEWLWAYREDEPMGGYDPYSSSKGCAELVTAVWRRSFFAGESVVALASARAGNVIGGDWAEDRIVPDCVRAFSAGKPLVLRNPGAVRPWQHVLDPLCGPLLLAEHLFAGGGAYAEGWNFGPSEANTRPVGYIVETLARHWDAATWRWRTGSSRTRPSMQDRCIEGPGAARVASAAGHRPALDWTAA
jgi:CDP-glucose 4,6-dehydratase